VTNTAESDETGISVQARCVDGDCYKLDDLSCRVDVDTWAERAVYAALDWKSGMILYEANQGGDSIGLVLKAAVERIAATHPEARQLVLKPVTAHKSKFDRALPLQQAIQQKRYHLVGSFPEYEDQMTTWVMTDPKSPDRIDADVHGFNELMHSPDKPKLRFRG